jgi:mevalonate kinase
MIIAFSGIRSATKQAVGGVRERRQRDPYGYDSLFCKIGALTEAGCRALQSGDIPLLGRMMNNCHDLLRDIGVSLPALDRMVESARHAGARGAKLSGAGLGGIVVALVEEDRRDAVQSALRAAGSTGEYRFILASR